MKRLAVIFCLVSFLSLAPLAAPSIANAQSTAVKSSLPVRVYASSREVTLQATVDQIVKSPNKTLAPGGHVILATPSGRLDGSVGPYALNSSKNGSKPLDLVPGQRVTVVGVRSTFGNSPIFLVRSISTGSATVNIRTKNGFLINPSMAKHTTKVSNFGGAR